MKYKYQFFILSFFAVFTASCKKGYVTPPHSSVNANLSVTSVTIYGAVGITAMTINELPFNFGLNNQGQYGITPNKNYPLSVVNGQKFNMKLKNGNTVALDTNITVSSTGLDNYYVYGDPANIFRIHIYTLHTEPQSSPAKGMAKVRFVNALSGLAGNGSINVQFSRKQNIVINGGKPLAFGAETPYVEVPYGIYQPLISNADGKPILTYVANLASSLTEDYVRWQSIELRPGGVYTIAVSRNFDSQSAAIGDTKYLLPVKLTEEQIFPQQPMGKVKFIHVDPYLDELSVIVDGKDGAGTLNYGADLNTLTLDQGSHHLQLIDQSGKTVLDQTFTVIDKDKRVGFLVHSMKGTPDLAWYDITNFDSRFLSANQVISAYFNFSPDATPASFLKTSNPTDLNLYAVISSDSITVNLPYLHIPGLRGANLNPIPGSLGAVLSDVNPQLMGIGFNVTNNVISRPDILTSATIAYPLLEYNSFANSNNIDAPQSPGQVYTYTGDMGYHLVLLTGLRYNAPAGRELKIKVIKYVQ